jgi:hypothetical protein
MRRIYLLSVLCFLGASLLAAQAASEKAKYRIS